MATDHKPEDSLDSDATVSRTPHEHGGGARTDIPGYEILRELYSGGQGVVYLAVQKSTHRKAAIKLLHRRHDASAEAQAQARFEREVGLVAQFDHPNIVKVFDLGLARSVGPAIETILSVTGQPVGALFRLPLEHNRDRRRAA